MASLEVICEKCGFREYRPDYPLDAYSRIKRLGDKGIMICSRCRKRGAKVKELKKDEAIALRKKFPNKRAIYTEKTVEELLELPDDSDPNPDIEGALHKKV